MRHSIFLTITIIFFFTSRGFAQTISPVYKDIIPNQRQASDFAEPSFAVQGNDLVMGANTFDLTVGSSLIIDAGVVHVFSKINNIWKETQTLKSDNPSKEAWFGKYVSIRKNFLLVTEHRAIKVKQEYEGSDVSIRNSFIHVYIKENNTWMPLQKLEDDKAFYEPKWIDDSSFVCGVPFANKVIIYKLSRTGVWETFQTIKNSDSNLAQMPLFGSNTLLSDNFLIIADQNYGDLFSRPGKVYVYTKLPNKQYEFSYSIENPIKIENSFGGNMVLKDSLLLISCSRYSKDINTYKKGWIGVYKLDINKATLLEQIMNNDLTSQTLGEGMLFYKNSLFISKSIYDKPDELIEYRREKNSFIVSKKYTIKGSDVESLKSSDGQLFYFVVTYETLADGTSGRTGKVIEMTMGN